VLLTSIGTAVLLLTPLELPAALGHSLRRAMREADTGRLGMYLLLITQLMLYLVLALVRVDFAALIGLLGLGYLLAGTAEAMWGYCVLTLLSLPADIVALLALPPWGGMGAPQLAAHSAHVAIVIFKGIGPAAAAQTNTLCCCDRSSLSCCSPPSSDRNLFWSCPPHLFLAGLLGVASLHGQGGRAKVGVQQL